MYIGLDKETKECVYIDEANLDREYICPHCNSKLIQKRGDIIVHHFAHESITDCDTWSHEMSDWHKEWQEQFPKENREVDITVNGKTHRADVCVNGYVIEFQHSPMSSYEFDERNNFYNKAGYKVIWVFDLSEQFENRQIVFNKLVDIDENSYKILYNWNHRLRTFDNFYPHKNKNVIVFFQFGNEETVDCVGSESIEVLMLNRVVWAIEDNDSGYSNFKRFYVRHDIISFEESVKHHKDIEKSFTYDMSQEEREYIEFEESFGGINGYIGTQYEFLNAIDNKDF